MSVALELSACTEAYYREGKIHVSYSDGRQVSFAVSDNRLLRGQPEDKLNHVEIGRFGLYWPDLDEDLSHAGLRLGHFGLP